MAKKQHEQEEPLKDKIQFCTACGDSLEDFFLTDEAEDLDSIRKRHAKCKETGKFDGDVCARFFIARTDDAG